MQGQHRDGVGAETIKADHLKLVQSWPAKFDCFLGKTKPSLLRVLYSCCPLLCRFQLQVYRNHLRPQLLVRGRLQKSPQQIPHLESSADLPFLWPLQRSLHLNGMKGCQMLLACYQPRASEPKAFQKYHLKPQAMCNCCCLETMETLKELRRKLATALAWERVLRVLQS